MNTRKLISLLLSLALLVSMISLVGIGSTVSASDDRPAAWGPAPWGELEPDTVAVINRDGNWVEFSSLFPDLSEANSRTAAFPATGNTGALRSAQPGEVVVMVANEFVEHTAAAARSAFVAIDSQVTLDMAGRLVQVRPSAGNRHQIFDVRRPGGELIIRNTVNGEGEVNISPLNTPIRTANAAWPDAVVQPGHRNALELMDGMWVHGGLDGDGPEAPVVFSGNIRTTGLTFAGNGIVRLDNVNVHSTFNDTTDGHLFSVHASNATTMGELHVNDSRLWARSRVIDMQENGSANLFYANINNSVLNGAVQPIMAQVADRIIIGTVRNSTVTTRGGGQMGIQLTTNSDPGFTFINSTLQSAADNAGIHTLGVRGGTVTLDNTVVTGTGNRPRWLIDVVTISTANPPTLITKNGTRIFNLRHELGINVAVGINFRGATSEGGALANAVLGAGTRIEAGLVRPAWVNLYHNEGNRGHLTLAGAALHDGTDGPMIAPGTAVFNGAGTTPANFVPSADNVMPRDYDPFTVTGILVIDYCEHWGAGIGETCDFCLTQVPTPCDCDEANWTVTTPPTCVAQGEETREGDCEIHGSNATRPIEIDPDAHNFGTFRYNNYYHWLECNYCEAEQEDSREAHSFTVWTPIGGGDETSTCDHAQCAVTSTRRMTFEVTLDGVAETVEYGADFIFPASAAAGFIAYTDGDGNFFDVSDTVPVTSALEFTTVALSVQMRRGAAMRLGEPSGLRFLTEVDTEVITMLRAAGAEVTMGTLIAPADLLGGAALTMDIPSQNRLDVRFGSTAWHVDDSLSFVGIAGTIANVRDANTSRDFVGRGYVIVELGSITRTIYARYYDNNVSNNTRSIGYIASRIIATSEYSGLSLANQAVVRHYYDLWNAQND